MHNQRRLTLTSVVGAIGIVYGDIGTSPLYTMQNAVDAAGRFSSDAVLGVLSLIFWSLALFALAQRRLIIGSTWAKVAVGLALAGTAFFFCDALVTPAISVLSAVEG